MNLKSPRLVTSILSSLVYVFIANLLNFNSAAAGSGIRPSSIFISLVFLALWGWQLAVSATNEKPHFFIFTVVYWLAALSFYWMTYFAIAFNLSALSIFGLIGMLMLYVPLYPFVALVRYYLLLDYFIAYTIAFAVCFALLLVIYGLRRKKALAALEDQRLMDSMEDKPQE